MRDDEDEVVVVADLPGVERENHSVRLLSPRGLEISSERRFERTELLEGGQIVRQERLRVHGAGDTSPAPCDGRLREGLVTNGVLEVRLGKAEIERGERIPTE